MKLEALVVGDDAEAPEVFLEMEGQLAGRLPADAIRALERSLTAYAYAEALSLVRAALERLGREGRQG